MASQYESTRAFLESRGVKVNELKSRLFGALIHASYPFGDKEVAIDLDYSSFHHSLMATFLIPYSPIKGPLMEEYDRVFPEEKSAWGRSSPKFEQAIVDYMRGQTHSGTKVELRNHKSELFIQFFVSTPASKEAGLLDCLKKASFEMRQGMIHGDVLFHMFAI